MLSKFILIVVVMLFIVSCKTTEKKINSLSFTIDSTFIDSSSNQLIARGMVTNKSRNFIKPPWYIEGQFYAGDSLSLNLGKNYTQMNIRLSPSTSTFWTIYFTSANINVLQYPNFRINDLRGTYKN